MGDPLPQYNLSVILGDKSTDTLQICKVTQAWRFCCNVAASKTQTPGKLTTL
jgi:hypothetical protein